MTPLDCNSLISDLNCSNLTSSELSALSNKWIPQAAIQLQGKYLGSHLKKYYLIKSLSWYFSCWLVPVERFQHWGGLFTFLTEIFSVWMHQRRVQKLREMKSKKDDSVLKSVFNNCHFNFAKWPCNFQNQLKWSISETRCQIKVASVM